MKNRKFSISTGGWYGKYPMICSVLYIPGGFLAGFPNHQCLFTEIGISPCWTRSYQRHGWDFQMPGNNRGCFNNLTFPVKTSLPPGFCLAFFQNSMFITFKEEPGFVVPFFVPSWIGVFLFFFGNVSVLRKMICWRLAPITLWWKPRGQTCICVTWCLGQRYKLLHHGVFYHRGS